MKKAILLCGALLALTSSVASAQGGLNFAWDGCPLAAGTATTTFGCDEFDAYAAFGAFVAPTGLDGAAGSRLNGQDIVIDIETASSALPQWWDFTDGGCRPPGALLMGFVRPTTGCSVQRNYWAAGAGGVAAYRVSTTPGAPTPAPNRARIIGAAGIPDANAAVIAAGTNVFSFSLTIDGVGTGTCGGCNTPVALVLNQITLGLQNGDQARVTAPGTNNCISANGAPAGMCGATSARNKTWGQVKALYR